MADRLPMIGTPEFYERCAEADKKIIGIEYERNAKPKREKAKYTSVKRNIPSEELKAHTLQLWDSGKYTQDDVTRMIYKETGFYLTKSSLKNWVWLRNKERRDAKPQN